MDELAKIQAKTRALIGAREYLLRQSPSDLVALSDITEKIVDLTARHLANVDQAHIPKLSGADKHLLEERITDLTDGVVRNESSRDILAKAGAVFDLKPWPP